MNNGNKNKNGFKVIIEETVSKSFVIEASTAEEALKKAAEAYNDGRIVLEPGELEEARAFVETDSGNKTIIIR